MHPIMSCCSSGVLQPSGLIEATFLHTSKFSSLQQFDVRWANGESRTAELLSRIQPNGQSELQRKAVADYVSRLVRKCLNCEVFRFGSVPLKTYLPDGDIDLTAFSSHQELGDSWAFEVQTALEHEIQRKDAEFTVSNVQCIHAEVKIVKCVVENVVVDISLNQLGGLCTLCFLEEVDRLIQRNHLFKRSIILVKAWCYYESRILGAHHALISTYALETLVLYIFNVFHSTLRGPLEVLFTFLDYFSKFDWENYCVSLWGPVPLAALPDLTAEPPLKDGGKLLLSKGFLEACSALYDVFPKGGDTQARTFSGKYLNIIDPLRINNNLGRSVSQASYHRIKSAFHLGARQLTKVFEVVDKDFPKCLDGFFSNTWETHQNGHRPDAPTSAFLPFEKFVYKTDYLDMLRNNGAKCIFELKTSTGEGVPKTCESSSMCNMSLALNTDSQVTTSSVRKTSLESLEPMETCKASAFLKRSTSERRLERSFDAESSIDADMMKGWGGSNTVQQLDVGDSPLKSPVEGRQGAGTLSCDVFLSKAASDRVAVMHGQSTTNIAFVRGKSWPTFNSQESKGRAANSAASNGIRTVCTSSVTSDIAMQKPPGFLFPESRDLLYAPFPRASALPDLAGEKGQNLACAPSMQIKPSTLTIESSQKPPLEDVRSLASPIPNVDSEHNGMYLFDPNNHSTTHAKTNRSMDESNGMGEPSVNGYMPKRSQTFQPPSMQGYFDAHHVSRSKEDLYNGTEATMEKASDVQEGGNYMAQSSIGAIPVVSYYHPFYPTFPVNSFGPHKGFVDGMPRENTPHVYHDSGQIPESTTAALSARFASLSAEESGMEPPPPDLLRSDLANHLRNLEFGRWCQEPVPQPFSESPFMYHSGQDPYLWGVAPFTPFYGLANQVIDNSKGPVPSLFLPQNVEGMPHLVSGPSTAQIGHPHKQGMGTGTFLPVRNSMSTDLKPLSPPIALQHDQGPMRRRTHFPSMIVAPPSQHGSSNGVTHAEVFVDTVGEHGAIASNFSNHLEPPGGYLPLVAGQLEFGSLGPIEIMNFPCGSVDTKHSNILNTGGTSSGCFPPFSETRGDKKALANEKLRDGA